jgi:hypothetical protein
MADKKELDPFDASVLSVLAKVPADRADLRQDLVGRIQKSEGKEVARAIMADDSDAASVSENAKSTAAYFKKAFAGG